ncbi:MAG: acid shock protein, partial [Oscillospiraceae bacterium]|nr:acid shock protein [Oscillospiraceae bacterium]
MKKVLSVLLAAAMVMGMSVSAFAAEYSAPATGTGAAIDASTITWGDAILVNEDGHYDETVSQGTEGEGVVDFYNLTEGDTIYFEIYNKECTNEKEAHDCAKDDTFCTIEATTLVNQKVPSNWMLKIKNSEYIKDAELVRAAANNTAGLEAGAVYAKVVLNSDFKAMDEQEAGELLKFFMYIWDTEYKVASEYANVHFAFAKYDVVYVTNDMALVDNETYVSVYDVIEAREDVYYKLHGKNSATVVFSVDEAVYVTAKMWKGDSYMIKSDVDAVWSKDLSKEYDTDIEVLTIESNLDIREVLWESAKDNKQIVEVIDGALVAVDSEWVTKYEVIDGVVLAKGYIAETEEGSYALISADIELIEVEEEATEEETKENPSTGANDFVGAAVALAVVSVA